jgi:hypothetical protein
MACTISLILWTPAYFKSSNGHMGLLVAIHRSCACISDPQGPRACKRSDCQRADRMAASRCRRAHRNLCRRGHTAQYRLRTHGV